MANLSLRGLDRPTLSRLKSNARRRGISVNRLIVETLRQQYAGTGQTFDDLDLLAGTWSKSEGAAFDAALRKSGAPIPTNDLWIAALARQHRLPLFSFDAHFAAVPGLALIDLAG